jgi:hypothetical protein
VIYIYIYIYIYMDREIDSMERWCDGRGCRLCLGGGGRNRGRYVSPRGENIYRGVGRVSLSEERTHINTHRDTHEHTHTHGPRGG